ncbi:MAG: XkdX family protein [Oscillospiraceae bacterium]|nr:XkdX family protein [Oscillospiraceae bacterium]
MNEIWANRLVAGTKAWAEVPASRKNAVKEVLRVRVEDKAITAEQYEEITGEVYEA